MKRTNPEMERTNPPCIRNQSAIEKIARVNEWNATFSGAERSIRVLEMKDPVCRLKPQHSGLRTLVKFFRGRILGCHQPAPRHRPPKGSRAKSLELPSPHPADQIEVRKQPRVAVDHIL